MTEAERQETLLRVPLAGLAAGEAVLPAEAARYVVRVHRLRQGERFIAFDPAAELEAVAQIVAVERGSGRAGRAGSLRVRARLSSPRAARRRAVRPVTLVQAMGKGAKLDRVVRDATELGATRVVPALAARSVKRPSQSQARAQADRWRRIAVEAARQCQRGDAPTIEPLSALPDALDRHAPNKTEATGVCLVPTAAARLGDVLTQLGPDQAIVVVVGPEGGLSSDEISRAVACGFQLVTLGPFVLRTETTCAAVLGAVLAWSSPPAP